MMDANDSIVFRQDDLKLSSFRTFEDMRKKGELIDFKITFQNRSYACHRLVLAAAIPFFRENFRRAEEEMRLENVDPDSLESVMNFAYSGEIEIASENVQSLLLASDFLQLTQITDACWEFLENRLCLNNVWQVRSLAESRQYSKLIDLADNYIRQNFEAFCKTEHFLALPFLFLREILRSDDVKVSTEEKVFEGVIRWVKDSPSTREDLLPDLLSAVRLSHLSPCYLTEIVLREEVLQTSIPCRNLLDEAKLYSWSPEKLSAMPSFATQSRIYEGPPDHQESGGNSDGPGIYAVCSTDYSLSVKFLDVGNMKWTNLSTFEFESESYIHHAAMFNETFYIFLNVGIFTIDVKTPKCIKSQIFRGYVVFQGMVLHNDKFYFFGYDDDSSCDSDNVRCFNPKLNRWLPTEKMRRPLENMGVASLTNYIYITGGSFDNYVYKTVERYNPTDNEWGEVSPMLCQRYDHGCTSLEGKIYVCGGFNNELFYFDKAEVYDPLTNQWNYISSMIEVKYDLVLVPANRKLYALDKEPKSYDNLVHMEIYNPEEDKWKLCVVTSEVTDRQMFLVSALAPSAGGMKENEED